MSPVGADNSKRFWPTEPFTGKKKKKMTPHAPEIYLLVWFCGLCGARVELRPHACVLAITSPAPNVPPLSKHKASPCPHNCAEATPAPQFPRSPLGTSPTVGDAEEEKGGGERGDQGAGQGSPAWLTPQGSRGPQLQGIRPFPKIPNGKEVHFSCLTYLFS